MAPARREGRPRGLFKTRGSRQVRQNWRSGSSDRRDGSAPRTPKSSSSSHGPERQSPGASCEKQTEPRLNQHSSLTLGESENNTVKFEKGSVRSRLYWNHFSDYIIIEISSEKFADLVNNLPSSHRLEFGVTRCFLRRCNVFFPTCFHAKTQDNEYKI